jgi:replicative DNA helicase Mcm
MKEEPLLEAIHFFEAHRKEYLRSDEILLDFNLVKEFSLELSDGLLLNPLETLEIFTTASERVFMKEKKILLTNVGNYKNIHKLENKDAGHLFTIKGIIKKITKVILRTVDITYECSKCQDLITLPQDTRRKIEPKKCSNCGSKFPNIKFFVHSEHHNDIQELNLEEIQGELDGSRQPQQLRVLLQEENTKYLCGKLQAGRRVEIIGRIEKLPKFMSPRDELSNLTEFMMYANNFVNLDKEEDDEVTEEEVEKIKEIAYGPNPLETLAKSLVPEIFGNLPVKRALVLQAVRGVEKTRTDGSLTNDMISILLCGDVGIAKSRTLKSVTMRTPRARMVVGTKTSKVGLGAMVSKDELTGEWSLEVGSLVLASGSTLCLDEMDKMFKEHLSELLEPMSSGTVSINKAGISALLPARTSILAAANPIKGNYDLNQPLAAQVNLDTPILNRFDLIFILLDKNNEKFDSEATQYVFSTHKEKVEVEISSELFRKYIAYCRRIKPVLDDELLAHLQDFYVTLRKQTNRAQAIPFNLRSVEAIIKLAEAHAKLRLSEKVEVLDFNVAKEIFMSSIKELAVDDETGQLDMSRLSQKVPMSKRSKMESFLEIFHKLAEENEIVEYSRLVAEAKESGMKYWEVDMFLNELRRLGQIYEPTSKKFKVVEASE